MFGIFILLLWQSLIKNRECLNETRRLGGLISGLVDCEGQSLGKSSFQVTCTTPDDRKLSDLIFEDDLFDFKTPPNNRSLTTIEILNKNIEKIGNVSENNLCNNLANLVQLNLALDKIMYIEVGAFRCLKNLKVLLLSGNNLNLIVRETFRGLANLETLRLDANMISTIEANSFVELNKLNLLYLDSNRLRVLKRQTFEGLGCLTGLSLINSNIEVIEINAFVNLKNLTRLFLAKNKLKTIDRDTFTGLGALGLLDLSENKLENIQNDSFNNLTHLVWLYLYQNSLPSFNLSNLMGLTNLLHIRLYLNRIEYISPLPAAEAVSIKASLKITDFQLSNNKLATLEEGCFIFNDMTQLVIEYNSLELISTKSFPKGNKLTLINLNSNQIRSIEKRAFEDVKQLKYLILSNNMLKEVSYFYFEFLESLETLELDNNKIVSIDPNSFMGLKSLKTLNMNNNKLIYLDPTFSVGLQSLNNLDLSLNQLQEIGMFDFMNLESLKWLDLSSNQLLKIEVDAFKSFSNLTDLDLSFNKLINLKSSLNRLVNLIRVDLSHNLLTEIGPELFAFNKNLEYFNLSDNNLIKINESSFLDMANLKVLSLRATRIKHLSFCLQNEALQGLEAIDLSNNFQPALLNDPSFKPINLNSLTLQNVSLLSIDLISDWLTPSLISLDLSDNENLNFTNFELLNSLKSLSELRLRNIGLGVKHGLELESFLSLETLDLSYNQINELNCTQFRNLVNLINVDFSNNNISNNIETCFETLFLDSLNLRNNKHIESIGKIGFNELNELDVKGNRLEKLPFFMLITDLDFSINTLNKVDLSFNRIKYLDSNETFKLKYAKYFNLDYNHLDSLADNTFSGFEFIEYLSIAYNSLKNITVNMFQDMVNLKLLNLSSNRLEIIEANSFLNLKNLELLNLSNNSIFRFDEANLNGMENLVEFYLENNGVKLSLEAVFDSINGSPKGINSLKSIYVSKESIDFFVTDEAARCFVREHFRPRLMRDLIFYKFYETVNVFTLKDALDCEMTFLLLRLNMQLNIKSENDFERFYDKCKDVLIEDRLKIEFIFKYCR